MSFSPWMGSLTALNTKKQWQTGLANTRGDAHHGRKLHSGQVRIIRKLLRLGADHFVHAAFADLQVAVGEGA